MLRQFSGLLGVPGAQPSSHLAGTPGLEPGLTDLEFASLAFNVRPFVSCIREDSNLQAPLRGDDFTGRCLTDSASDARLFEKKLRGKI